MLKEIRTTGLSNSTVGLLHILEEPTVAGDAGFIKSFKSFNFAT